MSGSSSRASGESRSEPLYQVKLLSALRSGDPALIHPFLAEIGKDKRKSTEGNLDTGAAALHLAVRCSSLDTVALLLSHRAISPNGVHPPGSGTTPLHLSASLGRVDIVNLLLDQDNIDDTLLDAQGRSCKDVAKGKDVIRAIEDSRLFLNASYRSLLHSYIMSAPNAPPSTALINLLESPRVRFVNLSYLDDDSGTSLLHEAAKRKDLRLIELAVRAGADVFVRNRRGKMAYEGAGKDDRVRVFLRQFANHDTTLIQTPSLEPPTLKGYLNKYTNVAKGYNTRWFVLKGGVLSYYRHQEDETVASRGSISMKTAILKTTPSDRLRFEVHSTPSRGHSSGVQKWYMKANHPVEASRWTQAIKNSVEWYKRTENNSGTDTDGPQGSSIRQSDSSSLQKAASASMRSLSALKRASKHASQMTAASSTTAVSEKDKESITSSVGGEQDAIPNFNGRDGDADDEDSSDSSEDAASTRTPPHQDSFDLHSNTTAAQMELTGQMLADLDIPKDVKDAVSVAQRMLNEYVQMAKDREEWWKKQAEKERQRQVAWEESLAVVVREGETLENELRMRSRRRGSRFFEASEAGGTLKQRPSALIGKTSPMIPEDTRLASSPAPIFYVPSQEPSPHEAAPLSPPDRPPLPSARMNTQETIRQVPLRSPDMESTYSTDDEDEFFDAIESNAIPNLVVPEPLMSPAPTFTERAQLLDTTLSYEGYKNLRQKLVLTNERPPTSLWSILKHSIGKDLTRISFPVFFNEPTSMLQRMAEDMEFAECLDVAVQETDPLRRIAYVAAFAMSNYSSTIGRIAKPFNPMLNETFEYVRLDREYRYMSEQVSHHPPISACWAESPRWRYYGEVDAQNKFMGKSFEIRPTGVAHADLLLPPELAEGYPQDEGKAVEHYSWKKVTTNVSGFILGAPTIDHYGDMTVVNHRTGDQCILTFKPRGWRGRDAFEISGKVIDSDGNVAYEIAGRWNSQLIARIAASDAAGSFHPDQALSPSRSPEYILLWRNSEKPEGSPFNLTPFAITLNDCPRDSLKPYLCPTDCRLRPDQRAFEMGRYEEANDLKGQQEDRQRATRRAREEGRAPPHKPRWFSAETDGDTGERVWAPARVNGKLEYWQEREKAWKNVKAGQPPEWKDVEDIFIEEPDFIENVK